MHNQCNVVVLAHTYVQYTCTSHLACFRQRKLMFQLAETGTGFIHTVFAIQMPYCYAPHTMSTLTQHIKMRTCSYTAKRTCEHCIVEVAASILNQQGVEVKSWSAPDISSSGHDTQRPNRDAAVSHPSNVCVCVVSTCDSDIIASRDND